ncbi:SH3 domain-containing protein [Pseudoponticoccus marisrubri]|uniref:SH3b domain-containing protein n=1 Tax=Pseudoponticoccus marisrubri TaxID=1685382 RepID=A0A0W7WJE4_9RHOB|nr:SH3 domain-containing protein [Pseudoponticoccus marisrubri]KUF10670.1 hypothetical protein AVJ23_12425 [Pseudoponticoccus marisrubri]
MRALVLALLVALSPLAVAADPVLYHVTDVAADDVLNIRAEPRSGTEILGALGPDDRYVEVLELDSSGKWGLVRAGEAGMGWVFMRYMAAVPGATYPDWPHLRCSGSEYPWSFIVTQGGAAQYRVGYGEQGFLLQAGSLASGGEHLFARGVLARGEGITVTAAIQPGSCSSTMIDAEYGLRGAIWALTAEGERFHNGCCVLTAPPAQ